MAIIVDSRQEILTKKYQVVNFSIFTPPGEPPSITIVYGEHRANNSGEILFKNGQIACLNADKQKMIDWLPANNSYGLPTFTGLYLGLRSLFEDQFKINFSGQFPV